MGSDSLGSYEKTSYDYTTRLEDDLNNSNGTMSANSIKVVARFRPQNRIELESGGKPIVSFDSEDTCTINVCAGPVPFAAWGFGSIWLTRGIAFSSLGRTEATSPLIGSLI